MSIMIFCGYHLLIDALRGPLYSIIFHSISIITNIENQRSCVLKRYTIKIAASSSGREAAAPSKTCASSTSTGTPSFHIL